jgi:hypothetical protein
MVLTGLLPVPAESNLLNPDANKNETSPNFAELQIEV